MKTKYSAKALITSKENRRLILLIRERLTNGRVIFDLPGGKMEAGETKSEALNRELAEELGIKVDIIKEIGTYWFIDERLKVKVVCFTHLSKVSPDLSIDLSKNPAEHENILDAQWMKVDTILNSDLPGIVPSLKKLLQKITHCS